MKGLPRALFRFLQRNQNLLLCLSGFGAMLGLGMATDHWLFYRTAYLLGGIIPLSFLWARSHLWGLEVSITRGVDRLQVGQSAEAQVTVTNRGAFPKLWLEVQDCTDMPASAAETVVTLRPHSDRHWSVRLPCTRRGLYTVGPVKITTGDPFGLFHLSRRFGQPSSVLVLPRAHHLERFWAPPAQLFGDATIRRPSHHVTPNAAAIRDYQPGDSFNRIHWPSTARLKRLMVKTFEMDPTSNVWIVLDLFGGSQAGHDEESTEEYAVQAAASLAQYFLNSNRTVGLLAEGHEAVFLEPARGSMQFTRILEALAKARAEGKTRVTDLLAKEERRFQRNTTLLVLTPAGEEEWVAVLRSLAQRGARSVAVLLDAFSFDHKKPQALPLNALAASGVLTYTIRKGDELSLSLGPDGRVTDASKRMHQTREYSASGAAL